MPEKRRGSGGMQTASSSSSRDRRAVRRTVEREPEVTLGVAGVRHADAEVRDAPAVQSHHANPQPGLIADAPGRVSGGRVSPDVVVHDEEAKVLDRHHRCVHAFANQTAVLREWDCLRGAFLLPACTFSGPAWRDRCGRRRMADRWQPVFCAAWRVGEWSAPPWNAIFGLSSAGGLIWQHCMVALGTRG